MCEMGKGIFIFKEKTIMFKKELNKKIIIDWLKEENPDAIKKLFDHAYQIKEKFVGKRVYLRGIVEFSNICNKNCFYCGIRKDNKNVTRYRMTENEIVKAVESAYKLGHTSVVIQSGEIQNNEFFIFMRNVIKRIKAIDNGKIGITLSLGEQPRNVLKNWFEAGAHRYLLRIETSNEEFYSRLHPDDHNFDYRLECLKILRNIGYQVGTGMMIGLPSQTYEDMTDDILFFKDHDIDMIGMGPYITHSNTPLQKKNSTYDPKKNFELGLKMIALTRILLKDVNIVATTALQALHPTGREQGILAGANIIMPNITPPKYRESYQLYDNKPCLDENAKLCTNCLTNRIKSIGESIIFKEWGDSVHYFKRSGAMSKNSSQPSPKYSKNSEAGLFES